MSRARLVLCLLGCLLLASSPALATPLASRYQIAIDPNNSFHFLVLENNQLVLRLGIVGWGPNWGWTEIRSTEKAKNGVLTTTTTVLLGDKKVELSLEARLSDTRTLNLRYSLKVPQTTALTAIAVTVNPAGGGGLGITATSSKGAATKVDLPAGIGSLGVGKEVSILPQGSPTPMRLQTEPALSLGTDGELRLILSEGTLKPGTLTFDLKLQLAGETRFYASKEDFDQLAPPVAKEDWFPFEATYEPGETVIGMESWLDKPAGGRGRVVQAKEQFQFSDGTPVKFWGTNLSFSENAPSKIDAEATARRFARYGINAVRMHKFTGTDWEGIGDPNDATKMTPEGLDRFDYFADQLRRQGIYYGWSHSFQLKVRAGNKAALAGFQELMDKGGNTYAVINWAEDVQDLMISMVVGLLKHRNPYSGKTYAEDPALSFLEIQNEDDIFFYSSDDAYRDFPTYRRLLELRFGAWLKAKYRTQDRLALAWAGALQGGESLESGSMKVQANPWFMGSDHLPRLSGGPRQRLLDNAAFLHETQNKFYDKFVRAVRGAGYQGPLIGSPWAAPGQLPHLYNLKSDSLVGTIDRHDYFGDTMSSTMLRSAGSGYLSAGLQQVAGRPFSLSEWITVYPSLYSAEGPLLVSAYGLGLQGWDASYIFQSTSSKPQDSVGNLPWGVWNADAPNQIGQFPILGRMVMRGDLREAPVISVRRVGSSDLAAGVFHFDDLVKQEGDKKVFGGTVPARALALGRNLIEFSDTAKDSMVPGWNLLDAAGGIRSSTAELLWDEKRGVVSLNSPGTQGYVGFSAGNELQFSDVSIKPETEYAMVLLTAESPKGTLRTDRKVLLSVVARNVNSGMRVLSIDQRTIVDNGTGPILMEPVKATIHFTHRTIASVRNLDHDGRATNKTVAVKDGSFVVDGVKDRALYYEIVFKDLP